MLPERINRPIRRSLSDAYMPRQKPSILIFEDDEATRDLYRRELGRVYRVIACSSEREILAQLQSEPVTALVVEPTGLRDESWSFIAALRAAPDIGQLPIILCSTLDARRRGAELGVAATLIKPIAPSTLLATLDAILQSR